MAHSINKKGFCLLAGIPDLWMRMHTTRATELLVNMNTRYCLSGRSTRARICSLVHLNVKQVAKALDLLKGKKTINKQVDCRISSTIQHLKEENINIIVKKQGDESPISLSADIRRTLEEQKGLATPITVYTDGSTNPKLKGPNSGAAIVVTDNLDQTIWSGGLIVRTDGNNFIAEIAAASIAITGCPLGVAMLLKTDSTAAIGALARGIVSERKRVRTAGRPWINFCRDDLLNKRRDIRIQHVSSHKGTITAEQRGNDAADIIANEFRRQGELVDDKPYFTAYEEQFVMNHDGRNIQSDPRCFLKSVEIK